MLTLSGLASEYNLPISASQVAGITGEGYPNTVNF
jgi:hypothetical protein